MVCPPPPSDTNIGWEGVSFNRRRQFDQATSLVVPHVYYVRTTVLKMTEYAVMTSVGVFYPYKSVFCPYVCQQRNTYSIFPQLTKTCSTQYTKKTQQDLTLRRSYLLA